MSASNDGTMGAPLGEDERRRAPERGDEVATLRGMLDHHRDTLRWKCSGLEEEQLRRPLPPSDMTLAGLVLHLTMVEAGWFNLTFAGGIERPGWHGLSDGGDRDWAWQHAGEYSSEQLWAWYDEAVSVSDRVVERALAAEPGLDAVAASPDEPVSLRWILVHMIEEYARHNGHADLIRQAIDGATGE